MYSKEVRGTRGGEEGRMLLDLQGDPPFGGCVLKRREK